MKIPAKWKVILSMVQEIEPKAVLAGGALRDLDNGRPVKDLDIFVSCCSAREFEQTIFAFSQQWGEPVVPYIRDESYCVLNDRIMGVAEWIRLGISVQLVGLHLLDVWCPEGVIDRVDLGLCQIAWDGIEIYTTKFYDDDKSNEKITLVNKGQTPSQLLHSVRRYIRLTEEKYKGWRFDMVRP